MSHFRNYWIIYSFSQKCTGCTKTLQGEFNFRAICTWKQNWIKTFLNGVQHMEITGRVLIACLLTYLLTYLFTYSMEQSPSWEANVFLGIQENPSVVWNPKVHYRVYKIPQTVPILSHINPVHVPTSRRSTLILSSNLRLGLPSGSFPSGFPTSCVPYTC
jgi:hypothetical protein